MMTSADMSSDLTLCIYVGRKKRRAARGRTDVGDQPYEDPNMQVSSSF